MTKILIVLTGNFSLIRPIVNDTIKRFHGISYYKSLEYILRTKGNETSSEVGEEFYELLMLEEIARDKKILFDLEQDNRCVLVEQWHVGNLARIRVNAPKVGLVYEDRLSQCLSEFQIVDKQVLYISMPDDDVLYASASDTYASLLKGELRELSAIVNQQQFQLETIDGTTLPDYIKERFLNLVKAKCAWLNIARF